MKLHKSVKIKDTTSLFMNKYQYKVVLVCAGAGLFRGNKLDLVELKLQLLKSGSPRPAWLKNATGEQLDYCFSVLELLKTLSDYTIRIESPFINFYTNDTTHIEKLAAIDEQQVKFVSMPNKDSPVLATDTVIVKKIDFKYKVHIGKTKQEYSNFISWASNNKKIRLTNRVKTDLERPRSWGGSYFYVKDDKTLTMVKVFVGGVIHKIEAVIKA